MVVIGWLIPRLTRPLDMPIHSALADHRRRRVGRDDRSDKQPSGYKQSKPIGPSEMQMHVGLHPPRKLFGVWRLIAEMIAKAKCAPELLREGWNGVITTVLCYVCCIDHALPSVGTCFISKSAMKPSSSLLISSIRSKSFSVGSSPGSRIDMMLPNRC